MIELEFKIDCLDGRFCFLCKNDEAFSYEVETDISGLSCVDGELDQKQSEEFMKYLNEAQIEKWDRKYCGENPIEDSIKWSVRYISDDKEYLTEGEESFEPYNFECLLKAIKIADKQLEYFGW